MIGAQEAYRIGLVNEVVPGDNLIPRAEAILNKIFANAPLAVKFAIEAVNKGLETPRRRPGLRPLFRLSVRHGGQERRHAAFLEKRKPKFQGR